MKFLHRLLNPHCPDCKEEDRINREERLEAKRLEKEELEDSLVCHSCENLKLQNALLNDQVRHLISHITKEPGPVVESGPPAMNRESIIKGMPWSARKQMLENESRARATALRNAAKPDVTPAISTEDLEKELDVVAEQREKNA